MTKQTKVEVRCDAEEKARWQEAAGGPRKVSAWLRSLANTAAAPGMTDLMVTPEAIDEALGTPTPEPVVTPGRTSSLPQPGDEVYLPRETVAARKTFRMTCPRERHHRTGVYCGTCKKIN